MCFSSMVVPFFGQPIAINEVPVITALVAFGILGHLLMICAASTSDIAPYGYAGLLFAIIFGLTLYDESPDLITLLGASVIVGVGLYVWSRERLTQAQKTHG
jgi:drug/metabolite transporter (DMT)-like permease